MQSFPFDSRLSYNAETGDPIYDRAVSSQPLRELIKKLFTTGVMPNPSTNYQVGVGGSGMELSVQAGFAVVDGGLCKEDDETILELEASHNTYNRIDTVVLQWDENVSVRDAKLYIKKGTPSSNPTRPDLQRNNSIYEIGLADILVVKNTSVITADKITDTRMESERCGIVSSVSEWDTTTIYNQIQADLAGFKANEEADFLEWFDEMKDQLSEDAAGHLQNEIDALIDDTSASNDSTYSSNKINNELEVIQEQITDNIEDGATASRTYNAGEYIVRGGVYYRVKTTIASGTSFVVGTNIEETSVGDEISTINSNLLSLFSEFIFADGFTHISFEHVGNSGSLIFKFWQNPSENTYYYLTLSGSPQTIEYGWHTGSYNQRYWSK